LLHPPDATATETSAFDAPALDMNLEWTIEVVDDGEDVDVGQADQQLAHASSV
jgi:hypothetical protein